LESRCYKVLICDPKDATIPDLASLRTAVAMQALQEVPPVDRLVLEDDRIQRLVEAWAFFDTLVGVCDRNDGSTEGNQCLSCRSPALESKRPARQPVVGKPASESDIRIDIDGEDTQRLVGSRMRGEPRKCAMNAQWLEDHVDIVRTAMASHVDSIRLALDVVGSQLNASGMTLEDALTRSHDEACYALRCFVANIQVWGSLGTLREPLCPSMDRDIELFLARGDGQGSPELANRLSRVAASLTPDRLAAYHRHLSRAFVAQARREFRQYLSTIRRSLESLPRDDGTPSAQLITTVLAHLREIEGFLTCIYRFFKCVDLAGSSSGVPPPAPESFTPRGAGAAPADAAASDDSEEGREHHSSRPLRPTLDRSLVGYVMCIDCGHNGILSQGESQHLALHLKNARFGKYSDAHSKNDGAIP